MRFVIALLALFQSLAGATPAVEVPAPEAHFGFRMGADRQLAGAEEIEAYFERVAARSNRVKVIDIGPTTSGHRTLAAIVSAPENIRNLAQIREANQRLADARRLPPDEARTLAASHKVVLAIGMSIHATEVGGSQAAPELLHALATAADAETLDILANVVVILIPSLNPDGHRIVAEWYAETKNTPFEGAPLPRLDHPYAGHDINRDAFMMNLAESRNLARFFYTEWHPQVFLSMHQMGSNGPRMSVPPMSDPIDPNYDPVIWREAALLGSAMALELQRDGRRGVAADTMYDYYWPGYEDSAPLGHNTVCLLTEAAGVNIATPVTLAAGDLHAPNGPGDPAQIDFPDPWPGGRWSLRDIVDYDLGAARGLLHAVSVYRERILRSAYEMSARAVEAGRRGGPFAFIIPPGQHDVRAAAKLEELLLQGAIEIHRARAPFTADGGSYPAGTDIVLLAQPYRAYVKTLLEQQHYPARRPSTGGSAERPYDVAGWTLPAQMGVDVRTIQRPFDPPATVPLVAAVVPPASVGGAPAPAYYLVDGRGNGGAIAVNRLSAAGASVSWTTSEMVVDGDTYDRGALVVAGSAATKAAVEAIARTLGLRATGIATRPVEVQPVGTARIGLYKPWLDIADEGWTRWLLEQHEFRFRTIADREVREGGLRQRYDAIVLPAAAPRQLLLGNAADSVPAMYVGGLGMEGVAALRAFVEAGGTLVCLDQACTLAIEQLRLPVRDVTGSASSDTFYCPGSLIALDLDPLEPLAYGISPHSTAFFASSSAFEFDAGAAGVRVAARYGSRDLLVSGWLQGERVIASRPAVATVPAGAGRVVLLGFPVQHRAQTHATFRLLFNALLTARD